MVGRGGVVAALAVGLACTSLSVQAQGLLRSQTNRVTGAIQNQIRQAVKPQLAVRNSAGEVEALSLSADGRYLAIALHDNTVRIWDLRGGIEQTRIASPSGRFGAVRISGDDRLAVTGADDGTIAVWDAATGAPVRRLAGHQGAVGALALSRDGAILVSGGADGTVRLWDLASGAARGVLRGHAGAVATVVLSGDGALAASGGADGKVILWDRATASQLRAFDGLGGRVVSIGFDAAGRIVAGTADGVVHLFDRGGAQAARTFRAAPSAVSGQLSGDGKQLAVSDGGAKVNVVDLDSGKAIREIDSPTGSSRYVLVDVNQRRIMTGGADGQVRVWNLGDGANVAQIISTLQGWTVIDPQGRFDGSQQGVADVQWVANQTALPVDHFSPQYYEPGLLAKRMSDQPSFVAAATAAVADGILLPPQASLAAAPGPYAGGTPVELTVTAEDRGGGIAEVKLFHNGKLLPREALVREQDERRNNVAVRLAVFRVTPLAGVNHFEAFGVSQAAIDGVPAALDLTASGTPPLPDLHVVTIGINKYRMKELQLDYGAPDALAILQRLSQTTAGVFNRVVGYKVLDEAATRAGILGVLDGLRQTNPNDVVALYLAGHGEIVGSEWYFLPDDVSIASADALVKSSISATQLRDALARIGAQRILILIDACKSGGSIDAFSGAMDRKVLREVGREAGVAILAATRKDQLAAELPSLGHGAFTYILLEGLAGKADLDPPDGRITAAKLLGWSSRALPSFTQRSFNYLQVPVAYARGADFLLRRAAQ
jgi:Caspase domain/WD domain, G-beta repeat